MSEFKVVMIYADVTERLSFFKRMREPLRTMGYKVVFLTAKLSVYLQARNDGLKCILLQKKRCHKSPKLDPKRSLSVLNGYHSRKDFHHIVCQTYASLKQFQKEMHIEYIFIWNGTTTIARTLAAFGKEEGIKLVFFELSNLGPKIFVDPQGTNADSLLYKYPELLDNFDTDKDLYETWRSAYEKVDTFPPQAKNRTSIPWYGIVDRIGYVFWRSVAEDKRWGVDIFITRLLNKYKLQVFPDIPLDQPYAFLPLQVNDDSQIKLFSDIDNIALIDKALEICAKRSLRLIVKIHPAESDRYFIKQVVQMSKGRFSIAGNRTRNLIRYADIVVVNNSTVGLEAKIMNKKVEIYGKALYRYFDQERLQKYILKYLVPIDYFGYTHISVKDMEKVLKRAEINVEEEDSVL
jgi:capsular polysaccharide export protein